MQCMRHDTFIGVCGWNIGHMFTSNQACFAMEVFHLNVKDHLAFNKLETICHPPEHCMWLWHSSSLWQWQVDPERLSMAKASSTNFVRGRPYLWVFFKYLTLQCFTTEMIASLFFMMQNTHQMKPGSRVTPIWIANSARWTGCDSLRSNSFFQELDWP